MHQATIQQTADAWQREPDKARGRPVVKARSEGAQAVMEFGSFSWRCDLPQPLGGTNQAPSPSALLLSALAGCAVVFIRDTLGPQLGVRIEGVEAVVQCEADNRGLLGVDGALPDLRNLQLEITVRSPDPHSDVQRLYEVWLERCPVYLALSKAQEVATVLRVEAD